MADGLIDSTAIERGIAMRWGQRDWEVFYPWWLAPPKVRILIYADGSVQLKYGPFLGLQHVRTLLESRAYFYVDFDVQFVNRDDSGKKLTDLDIIKNFDQIWFFGFNSSGDLDSAEHTLLNKFMSAPKFGGVLVTGDHADLGKRLAGRIKRAGKMRRYPAPQSQPPAWNTTLTEGPDANATFDFDDQSDAAPQGLQLTYYPVGGSTAITGLRSRPHPVMCGPEGPIRVFPDHQHEGEALAPAIAANDPDWPTKNGHQEKPQVIARGLIKDPAASKAGQHIGVVSAYDGHTVDVGRIVADSTWHHWFDINLIGISPNQPYAGFDATAYGRAVLKQIDAYFLNVGVWLSPPG